MRYLRQTSSAAADLVEGHVVGQPLPSGRPQCLLPPGITVRRGPEQHPAVEDGTTELYYYFYRSMYMYIYIYIYMYIAPCG